MAQRGRPTKFKKEFVEQARKLAQGGWTDIEIARFFDIPERTFYRWQIEHPHFRQATEMGKDECDKRVKQSLYRKAIGYSRIVKKEHVGDDGKVVVTENEVFFEPDTTAANIWLRNRDPANWRDAPQRIEIEDVTPERSSSERARAFALMMARRELDEQRRTH